MVNTRLVFFQREDTHGFDDCITSSFDGTGKFKPYTLILLR